LEQIGIASKTPYTQIYKMPILPEDRELSWILIDYTKNNAERKGHQCADNTS